MNDNIATLRENIEEFERQIEEMNEKHRGQFVVFYNKEFKGAFDGFDEAARTAVQEYGDGPYLIRQVGFPVEIPMPASVAFHPIYA